MNISYDLALELKQAGFPQEVNECTLVWDKTDWLEACAFKEIPEDAPICPTLSELMEACGDRLEVIRRLENGWYCGSNETDFPGGNRIETAGFKSLEKCVAILWLALNEKV